MIQSILITIVTMHFLKSVDQLFWSGLSVYIHGSNARVHDRLECILHYYAFLFERMSLRLCSNYVGGEIEIVYYFFFWKWKSFSRYIDDTSNLYLIILFKKIAFLFFFNCLQIFKHRTKHQHQLSQTINRFI